MFKAFKDPQYLHVKALGEIYADLINEQKNIMGVIPSANLLDFNRIKLRLHSMGGLAGPRFALKHLQAVESITGYATVGFGHPKPFELAQDMPSKLPGSLKHELIPGITNGVLEFTARNLRDIIHYYMRLRVIFEGISCIRDKTIKEVDQLRDHGIPYDYIGFGNDMLVRPAADIAQYVSSFTIMDKYGHLAPQVKADRVARQAAKIALAA